MKTMTGRRTFLTSCALAGAAEKHGVAFRYGTTVTRVLVEHGRAVGVETADGERIPADVVVLNPDLPVAYRELLPPEATPARVKKQSYSPSCFLLLAGSSQAYSQIAHHNIHFGDDWVGTSHESRVPGCINHSFQWIEEQCRRRGLEVRQIGKDTTHGQSWLRIARIGSKPRIADIVLRAPEPPRVRTLLWRIKRKLGQYARRVSGGS